MLPIDLWIASPLASCSSLNPSLNSNLSHYLVNLSPPAGAVPHDLLGILYASFASEVSPSSPLLSSSSTKKTMLPTAKYSANGNCSCALPRVRRSTNANSSPFRTRATMVILLSHLGHSNPEDMPRVPPALSTLQCCCAYDPQSVSTEGSLSRLAPFHVRTSPCRIRASHCHLGLRVTLTIISFLSMTR